MTETKVFPVQRTVTCSKYRSAEKGWYKQGALRVLWFVLFVICTAAWQFRVHIYHG
jgi:hypothetical protein